MPRAMQASFVAGEISPALRARVDLEQYLRGVALARNVFVRPFGGLANRPGSRFIDYTFQDHVARLVPFRFDDDQQYALELTAGVLRVFAGGGQLLLAPNAAVLSATVGGGSSQWNDLSTGSATVTAAPGNPPLVSVRLTGASASVAIAEQGVALTHPGVELVLRLFVSAPLALRIGTSSGGEQLLAERVLARGWHAVAFTPTGSIGDPFYVRLSHGGEDERDALAMDLLHGSAFGLSHPYAEAELAAITWTQKADILTLAHPSHPPLDLKRYGALSWSLEERLFRPSIEAPLASDVSIAAAVAGAVDYFYLVTYQADSGEESLPLFLSVASASISETNSITITIAQPLPATVARAVVYRKRGGVYGQMTIVPAGEASFIDTGVLVPKIDQTAPAERNPFAEEGSNPACVAYWEQRLAFAGSAVAPDTVEMSKVGAFYNFGRSEPTRDSDAITFTPAGNLVRRIRHLVGAKALYLFTDSAVLAARRGDAGVTPAMEGGVSVELAKGATAVPPVQVGESVLFVTSAGRSLYSLSDRASTEGFVGQEVSLLSEHLLLESPIVDAAWCEVPHSLLWLVRADGRLAVLAYLDRQQVFGWSLCETAGRYEAVCAVREGGEDFLYAVVRRRLGGSWRRCVERMATRRFASIKDAFFVDCGLSLDSPVAVTGIAGNQITAPGHGLSPGDLLDVDDTGVPELDGKRFKAAAIDGDVITLGNRNSGAELDGTGWAPWLEGGVVRKPLAVLTGLGHLNGQTVSILADGSEHPQRVVTAGSIALQHPASRVHVGLPYVSDIQTLTIAEPPDGYGTRKRVVRVQAHVNETRGLLIGPAFDALSERPARSTEPWSAPAEMKSGLVEVGIQARWGLGGQVCFRQVSPLPFELLAVLPVFERASE